MEEDYIQFSPLVPSYNNNQEFNCDDDEHHGIDVGLTHRSS
jgi:hypothetical protein